MAFDGIMMHHLVYELNACLVGGRIDKIHQPEKDELLIQIRGQKDNFNLFISIESSMPYFTLTQQKKENPKEPPMFCMLMRKHLTSGRILSIRQNNYERVVEINIESKDEMGELSTKKLIIEIMGRHSNIILVKSDNTIIDSIKRITPEMSRIRSILPGLKYSELPTSQLSIDVPFATREHALLSHAKENPNMPLKKLLYTTLSGFSPYLAGLMIDQANLNTKKIIDSETFQSLERSIDLLKMEIATPPYRGYIYYDLTGKASKVYFTKFYETLYTFKEFDHIYEAVDAFYSRSNKTLKIEQRIHDIKKAVTQRLERNLSKHNKLILELETAENADEYRLMGELLFANLFLLTKGMNKITLNDYSSDPPGKTIEILLDVRLAPSENAQKYYKLYNKLKTAKIELQKQIEETNSEIEYLENVLNHMNQIEAQSEINDIISELVDQGILKKKIQKKKKKLEKFEYRIFVSSDGFDIYVGKNNIQNDHLTTKLASKKDIWLHTKKIPGSHVIIRTNGQDVPDQTIIEAASIAAYHSKARASSNVPVDYTQVKNVTKPSGSKPGMVIYLTNKTVYVTPDEPNILGLKKKNQ